LRLMTTDQDRIQSLIARYYAAANSKDISGVMACYAVQDPALLIYDVIPAAPFKGSEAVRQDWAGFFSAMREIHLERSDLEIISDGNLAFSHFTESVDLITNEGERVGALLRPTHVYRKRDDEWLIVHEHKSAPAANLHP